MNWILAKREAVQAGYDEAILLDISGFVAEASGENVFMVNKKDIVRTPPLSSPILAGITRRSVLRLLKDTGHPGEEVTFTRDALYISNEVFFTGTAAEDHARPRGGQPPDSGWAPGPVVKKVQDMYFRVVRGQSPGTRSGSRTCDTRAVESLATNEFSDFSSETSTEPNVRFPGLPVSRADLGGTDSGRTDLGPPARSLRRRHREASLAPPRRAFAERLNGRSTLAQCVRGD